MFYFEVNLGKKVLHTAHIDKGWNRRITHGKKHASCELVEAKRIVGVIHTIAVDDSSIGTKEVQPERVILMRLPGTTRHFA
jgi:hypothetical protein